MEWNDTLKAWEVNEYNEVKYLLESDFLSATLSQMSKQQFSIYHNYRKSIYSDFLIVLRSSKKYFEVIINEILEFHFKQIKFDSLCKWECVIESICDDLANKFIGIEKDFLIQNLADKVFKTQFSNLKENAQYTKELSENLLDKLAKGTQSPILLQLNSTKGFASYMSIIVQLYIGIKCTLKLLMMNFSKSLFTKKNYDLEFKWSFNSLIEQNAPVTKLKRTAVKDFEAFGRKVKGGDFLLLNIAVSSDSKMREFTFGKGENSCLGKGIIVDIMFLFTKKINKYLKNKSVEIKDYEEFNLQNMRGFCKLELQFTKME